MYGVGSEPDPRFTLANERTFLAWIRTSLALLAIAIAVAAFDVPRDSTIRTTTACVFVALAVIAAAQSWLAWSRTETALRLGAVLGGALVGHIIVIGVIAAMILGLVGAFV